MSGDDINVILYRLDQIEATLAMIHDEVRATNGRVTKLEMENAKWAGEERVKRKQEMIAMTVISGGILTAVVWFVQSAI